MKPSIRFVLILSVLAFCLILDLGAAEAKRLGGGGNLGGRPTYSRPYAKPIPPVQRQAQQKPQPEVQRAAPQAPTPQPQPGPFSGFGWGLGGFLAGGLLGSMLFGHGGMGGGFGGPGLLDIALIWLAVFFAVRFFRRRAAYRTAGAPGAAFDGQPGERFEAARGSAGFGSGEPVAESPASPEVPAGFDTAGFLAGAKAAYARLQQAWDRRDLNDIAQFTSPEMHTAIARHAVEDPGPSRTELLLVEARLLEVREEGAVTVASVFFDVLLREDQDQERPGQVREVWHFSRLTDDPKDTWRLEGIQQLEG